MNADNLSNQEKIIFFHEAASGYSIISRTVRFFTLADAALNMVRIAAAVLPCFPITFPKSSLATFHSITEVWLPSTSETETSSGLSTSAWAIYLIRSENLFKKLSLNPKQLLLPSWLKDLQKQN